MYIHAHTHVYTYGLIRAAISQDNEETPVGDAFPESPDESASQVVIDESGG